MQLEGCPLLNNQQLFTSDWSPWLSFVNTVINLSHMLTYNSADMKPNTKGLPKKANCLLYYFTGIDRANRICIFSALLSSSVPHCIMETFLPTPLSLLWIYFLDTNTVNYNKPSPLSPSVNYNQFHNYYSCEHYRKVQLPHYQRTSRESLVSPSPEITE